MTPTLLTLLLDLARSTTRHTHAPFIVELIHDVVLDMLEHPPASTREAQELFKTLSDLKARTRKATR